MSRPINLRVFARTAACAALMIAPLSVHAAPQTPGKTPLRLSPQTLRQIAALEQEADARTPLQQRISSPLLYTLKTARGEQIAPGVPTLRASVPVRADGLTEVDLDADVTADLHYALLRAGARITSETPQFGSVRAWVPMASLETIAALPGVRFVKPAVHGQPQNPAPRPRKINFLAPYQLPFVLAQTGGPVSSVGSVVDEGDKAHQADKARSTYHIDGTGVKVGVLSDSLDDGHGAYNAAVSSGDVSKVSVISGQAGTGEGEGLAMLEVVHHLAPGAQLYFATANDTPAKMAANILALQKAGCKVIIDDYAYPDESPFQDNVIGKAIDTATAAGSICFSCAANFGNLDANTSSVWENDYKDSGDTTFGDGDIHAFDSNGDEIDQIGSNGQNTTVELFWSDPLGKSSNDYDLIILDGSGSVVNASTDRQTGAQDPIETAAAADGDYIVLIKHKGSTRFLHVDLVTQNSTLAIATNDRTRGHNAVGAAFCVAATPAADDQNGNPAGPYPGAFNTSDVVETFSNDGPRHAFFDANGNAYTSSLTHTGGKILNRPDFTAADGTSSTLPAGGGLNPFFGTSCASPHAGAIAALLLSYNPKLTRAQIETALKNSATDIMASGYDRDAGAGILNALKAVQIAPKPASTVTLSSVVLTPTSVTAGQTSSGKITLSDVAPSGGVTISLKSSDTSSATVPSSVTIAAGNKSISFTVTTKSVTSKKTPTITATLGSSVKTAVLTINPAAATVTVKSLSVSPTSVKGGSANSTGTVTLTAAAPSGGLAVSLKSSDTSAATVSSTLNIAAGATSAAFKITTKSVTSMKTVTLTATAGSTSKTATLTVTGSGSTVTASALSFDPNSISSNGITTGTLTLSGNAPSGGADVALSSGGSAIETVTVPAGKSSTTFLLFSGVVSSTVTDTIDAAYGGKTVSAALTVKATTVKPTKISLSPSTVSGGGSTTITVTLSTTAPKGGAVVEIFQGSTDLGYALVPGGQTSTAVSYAPAPVTKTTTYTEKGTYNGTSVTTTLTVKP